MIDIEKSIEHLEKLASYCRSCERQLKKSQEEITMWRERFLNENMPCGEDTSLEKLCMFFL